MSDRLQYSFAEFLRVMQVSEKILYIFVESFRDRYVYSRIIDIESQRRGVGYQVVASDELQGDGEGKDKLLRFFEYLRSRSSLIDRFNGKTTISVFFLDKDVDDFRRTKRRSEHIVYTEMYELENYLFMQGDLSEAAAASASLDIQMIRNELGDYALWRQNAASRWKKWVIICLFSVTNKIGSMTTYGRDTSPINSRAYGPLKRNEYRSYLQTLRNRTGLTSSKFKYLFERLCRRVDKIYSEGQHDLIFKGKWYTQFLTEDIRNVAGSRRFDCTFLGKRLLNTLAATLDFDKGWADHFKAPVRDILVKAGI
jgi:hypothetical protein